MTLDSSTVPLSTPASPPVTASAPARPMRTPALVAGTGMLLMAVLAGWANFAVVEALVADGEPTRTARMILSSEGTFRLGIICLFAVAALDVVVAWALQAFFAPAHRAVATAAAWLRTIYAGIFAVAIAQLPGALEVLTSPASTALSTGQAHVEALRRIEAFHHIWDAGLVVFGLHLGLLGYLAWRASYAPRLVGWLLGIAAAGYVVDSLGALLTPGVLPEVAVFTFIGEVVLLGWLLVRGRSVTANENRTAPAGPEVRASEPREVTHARDLLVDAPPSPAKGPGAHRARQPAHAHLAR